jgi:hypothetical protein
MMGSPIWNEELSVGTGKSLLSTTNYMMLLFANLIDKNTTGLNALLDGILSSVFGTNFDAAVTRAAPLADNASIEISAASLEALGLSEMFESGDRVYIGKAELNVLFSAMRFVRASLKWVTAYDWNTDLSFLRDAGIWQRESEYNKTPANLPLRNSFLGDRNNGMMAQSKADFVTAIDEAIAAYTIMTSDAGKLPQGTVDVLEDYMWVKEGFAALKAAINGGNGGVFYAKEYSEGAQTYTNDATNAVFGINLNKFFTPGQLSLDKLIEFETTARGKTPKFYGFIDHYQEPGYGNWYNVDMWTENAFTSTAQMDQGMSIPGLGVKLPFDSIGFKYKLAPIKEVIILGLEDVNAEEKVGHFPVDLGKTVWDWYHQ